MTGADRDEFSRNLGVRPVRACAGEITQARRDRYYWLSWPIPCGEGVLVDNLADYYRVSFNASLPGPHLWADPGWTFCGEAGTRLPTFMRALPKKKETYKPAGIAATPDDARRRWVAHHWRYPPYQYRKEYCMRRKDNARILRPLNAN